MPRKRYRRPVKRPIDRTINPIDKASASPSGRGISAGTAGSPLNDFPDRKTGQPPIATQGGPSTSPDVNASLIMQNMIMNDDDKRWYKKLFKKQAATFLKPRNTVSHGFDVGLNCGPAASLTITEDFMNCLACAAALCKKHLKEGKKKKLLQEPESREGQSKTEVNSVAAGDVRGSPANQMLRARKKNGKINARSFGGGQVVGKY